MGAHTFFDAEFGTDAADAYVAAVNIAYREYGERDGYNGTISTTNGFFRVVKPKSLTDNEFTEAVLWAQTDMESSMWDDPENVPVLKQRRKFYTDGDRNYYKRQRALLTKWKRLSRAERKVITDTAIAVQKWGPCVAWRADRRQETTYRERYGLKGKRGGLWHFFGWAAS
jgi:hypothetical protein